MGFRVSGSHRTQVGLTNDGRLWFRSCCDASETQLTVRQALELRRAVDAFLTDEGWFRRQLAASETEESQP